MITRIKSGPSIHYSQRNKYQTSVIWRAKSNKYGHKWLNMTIVAKIETIFLMNVFWEIRMNINLKKSNWKWLILIVNWFALDETSDDQLNMEISHYFKHEIINEYLVVLMEICLLYSLLINFVMFWIDFIFSIVFFCCFRSFSNRSFFASLL